MKLVLAKESVPAVSQEKNSFITTKVAAELKTYEAVTQSIDESLAKIGLDYIDLLIIHSPQPWKEFGEENRYFEENKEAWKAMEDAYKAGRVRQSVFLTSFRMM